MVAMSSSKRRMGRGRHLQCIFLILAAMAMLLSNTIFDLSSSSSQEDKYEQNMMLSSSSTTTTSSCGPLYSPAQCQRRQAEFRQQLSVEVYIHKEMIFKAQQLAQQNIYHRQRPQRLQREHEEYYQEVQKVLLNVSSSSSPSSASSSYAAWKNFSKNSFADLSIVGFPKAGTSQLYKLLVSHPDSQPVFKRKEFCMDHNFFLDYTQPQYQNDAESIKQLQKKLWLYHKHVLLKRQSAATQLGGSDESLSQASSQVSSLLVNACLQTSELDYHIAYTPLPTSSKFLLLFRDPADWLWASWNFWVDKNLDLPRPIDHDWASVGIHYRSPELFHELILSQDATKSAGKRFRTMREQAVHVPRRLLYLVGRDKLFLIKSEEMKASNNKNRNNLDGFLGRLADFTGLDASKFDQAVAYGQTNCNAQKGFQNLCNASSSAYQITRYRPMLEATRQLIYIQFHEECKVWAEEFGIVYQYCLQAVPRPSQRAG